VGTGEVLQFGEGELEAEVIGRGDYGRRTLRFRAAGDFRETVERLGHVPLPPYIHRADEPADRERYQTVFARGGAAVAAPTAGLHFTPEILDALRRRGCGIVEITLEVGYGTFQPVRTESVERHRMQAEPYEIPAEAAAALEQACAAGRPVLAVIPNSEGVLDRKIRDFLAGLEKTGRLKTVEASRLGPALESLFREGTHAVEAADPDLEVLSEAAASLLEK